MEEEQEALVSISEASHILGVSEPALRQWTDEGKLKAFITPGGHRRYSRAELKKFLHSQRRLLGIKDLATNLEDSAPALRVAAKTFLHDASGLNEFSGESQEHLALLGRHFLKLIIKYISEPSKRNETLNLARDTGRELGETLARLGLPLTHSVQAFIMHRELIMGAVTNFMKRRGTSERVAGAIPLVNHILDQALISLVQAHQLTCIAKQQTKDLDDIHNTLTL